MGEWVCSAFGCLCGLLVFAKVLGTLWCLLELQRKWRSVRELWSIDWLDIVYRIEQEFGVALVAADFEELPVEVRAELTAGGLWEVVAARLRASGLEVPMDGWERLVARLCPRH